MSKDSSFDIVSEVDLSEMDNAINMAMKEVNTRFDFKGSCADIKRKENSLELMADDETRMANLIDILENKMIKREIHIKFLDPQGIVDSLGGNVKQTILIKQGLTTEKSKEISKFIRDAKFKVKSQINGDKLKVTAAKKDELQTVIQSLKNEDFGVVLQFTNYR
ncbi:MAG: YajQ family cyclic di-GMP-binding protein [Candidatus Margulisbacteria bacterium]|nr:YajQ family cyclic di-GMP-binding protein [Candidatus Margulisiibacteriota bacterium]